MVLAASPVIWTPMTDPTPVAFFNEAAREAHSEAIAAAFGACSSVTTDAALTAALEALPERSKAILALAALSDATIKHAVFDGVSNFCTHGGEPVEGDYCCPDCEAITDEVLRFLTALGLPVAEREATG
jgi:hypothetical protein